MKIKNILALRLLCLTMFIFLFSFEVLCFAGELVIPLESPKKSTQPLNTIKPLKEAAEISGVITLDIIPYPQDIESGRYLVEYYLNGELLYSTIGKDEENPLKFSLKYNFDTAKFVNGRYKIYVNLWDKENENFSAIGVKNVIINNQYTQ